MSKTTRRTFLKTATLAGTGYFVAAGTLRAMSLSANETFNVACIGVGGKGGSDSDNAAQFGNVIAICDVDENTLGRQGERGQGSREAEKFTDYRELLAKHGKKLQIATISTPDHMHAPATLEAMRLGISCYTQKPLTRTIYEARLMAKVAAETGVCTQMGNQGTALDSSREAIAQLQSGVLGTLKEVYAWSNRPDLGPGTGSSHDHGRSSRNRRRRRIRTRPTADRGEEEGNRSGASNGSTGRTGWALLPIANSGRASTTPSSGAAGGISAAVRWATWPATS